MSNLVVKNGFNGVHGTRNEGTAKNKDTAASNKQLPPLQGIDTTKQDAKSPRLLHRSSDLSSHANDYLILLNEDLKEIKHLALSLGIKRRIRAIDQYGGTQTGTITDFHQRSRLLVMPRKLPALDQPAYFGKQSIKWTKRQDSCVKDVMSAPSYDPFDAKKLPLTAKQRLKSVDIPHLGLQYRLPVVKTKRRHQQEK